MTGIIDRLRAMQGMGDIQLKALMDGVGPQAADEIERLAARLEATEEDRARFLVEMGRLCAQCDALRLRIKAAEKERDAMRAELMEQCRLLGMSAEREAKHLAQIDALERERSELKTARMAYASEFDGDVGSIHENIRKFKVERDALRAKVEQMERQEPVAWTTKLALEYGSSRLGF